MVECTDGDGADCDACGGRQDDDGKDVSLTEDFLRLMEEEAGKQLVFTVYARWSRGGVSTWTLSDEYGMILRGLPKGTGLFLCVNEAVEFAAVVLLREGIVTMDELRKMLEFTGAEGCWDDVEDMFDSGETLADFLDSRQWRCVNGSVGSRGRWIVEQEGDWEKLEELRSVAEARRSSRDAVVAEGGEV